ncbi:flagellar biosynthetic protein FliQ [Aliidiomarina quisquiliarum]|uniref:flagellar biosynthetic protein FliQ n=1 Tax=Aliidiomarina quisquiliarum TaxID=2938947 RepID=UPI00208E6DE9|nr:flagellar biosynthetic protein FliQ [Aliidiomarina quisquiliarum]MCO4322083.1 flagellar biosynthetic protein FliQ [Aliidiomarina quisquiliarum]
MSPEVFVDVFRDALFMVVLMVSAIIIPSLLVGLAVAVFQAATSINEQTLSFLPRLLVTISTIGFGGHWFVQQLTEFTIGMYMRIPEVIG